MATAWILVVAGAAHVPLQLHDLGTLGDTPLRRCG